jgi:hypothetical protein
LNTMNKNEFKELVISLMNENSEPGKIRKSIESAGVHFEFSNGFHGKVMERIYSIAAVVQKESEFARSLAFVFYKIALPGIAAIIILLISIYLMEGSFSINSFLGLGSNNEESIICLLTGN